MTRAAGESAYFSAPEPVLDPSLFSGMTLRPEVTGYILSHLTAFLRAMRITRGRWLHAWLAGSGISYQWRAARGNGDLDVLLGIDVPAFLAVNPGAGAGSTAMLASTLNEQMRAQLWPLTAAAAFGDSVYEVTYYWNPEVRDDITVIHPYAAWDLQASQWRVPPAPQPPVSSFPPAWHEAARRDSERVLALYRQWAADTADVRLMPASSPSHVRAAAGLRRVTAELRQIWEILHNGRRSAFTAGGDGWADWHNFRWQAAKASGTADRLREVIRTDTQDRAAEDTALYGAPVEPAETVLRRAAAARTRWAQR